MKNDRIKKQIDSFIDSQDDIKERLDRIKKQQLESLKRQTAARLIER